MAQGGLHEMDWGAALQAMARVSMAKPMGRDGRRQARTLGRGFHDPVNLARVEVPAFVRAEHRVVGAGTPGSMISASMTVGSVVLMVVSRVSR